jgi:hypothetical protein
MAGDIGSQLLNLLYGSLREEGNLQLFLGKVCEYTDSHVAGIQVQDFADPGGDILYAHGIPAPVLGAYSAEFAPENIYFQRSAGLLGTGAVLVSADVVTQREVHATRFYADWLRLIDTEHSATICGALDASQGAFLSLCRSRRDYDETDRTLLRDIAPHWVNVCGLRMQLNRARLQTEAFLASGVGVVYLDADGTWLRGNLGAERMLRSDWLRKARGGRLQSPNPATTAEFTDAVRKRMREAGGDAAVIVLRSAAGRPLAFARLHRLHGEAAEWIGGRRARLVMFARPIHVDPHPHVEMVLTGQFDLTPAEARLAMALYEKGVLAAAADSLGITQATARTRLQVVLGKVGLHSQRSLLLMLDTLTRVCSSAEAAEPGVGTSFAAPG